MTQNLLLPYGPEGFQVEAVGPEGNVRAVLGLGGAPTVSVLTFDTITLASANRLIDLPIPTFLGLSNGTLAYVKSVQSYFYRLTAPSPVSSDSITIVKPLGGASREVWVRLPQSPLYWVNQSECYIDAIAGNDENTGLFGSPLATFAELHRRVPTGAIVNSLTITYLTDAAANDALYTADWRMAEGANLIVQGTPTNLRAASTFTATTAPVRSGAMAPTTVTDGTLADWAPFIGKRIRITASADPTHVGLVGFVMRASAATVAETTGFSPPGMVIDGSILPDVGDTFVIEDLTIVPICEFGPTYGEPNFDGACMLQDLRLQGFFGFAGAIVGNNNTYINGCYCDGLVFATEGGNNVRSCLLASCRVGPTAPAFVPITACGITEGALAVHGSVAIDDDTYAEGVRLFESGYAQACTISLGNCAAFRSTRSGCYLNTGSTVTNGPVLLESGIFYGSGNTRYGIELEAHSSFNYITKPTCTGALGDTYIAGAVVAYAAVPSITAANAAAVVVWA